MNVNTFSCTVLWELLAHPLLFLFHFRTIFSGYFLRKMRRRFTLLAKLHKVTQLHLLNTALLHTRETKLCHGDKLLLCCHEKCQSQMKTVNHPVGAIEVLSRTRFRPRSNRVWKIFKDFLSTGFSFIQFHLLLLSSIFQLFTELEWPPSLGLPAC